MSGWVAALIIAIAGGVAFEWQNTRLASLRESLAKAETLLEAEKRSREINNKYDEIDRGLHDGGEDGLSDYMRDAAGQLWP